MNLLEYQVKFLLASNSLSIADERAIHAANFAAKCALAITDLTLNLNKPQST